MFSDRLRTRAYPRGRGGTRYSSCLARPGPIPAGRGNHGAQVAWARGAGAYPRGRGGDRRRPRSQIMPAWGLSPRVRGRPWPTADRDSAAPGLSPRVRGRPGGAAHWPRGMAGPIPAGAGETSTPLCQLTPAGLSPRVRGRPIRRRELVSRRGPIPAGAGEPSLMASTGQLRAYPRGRGGAATRGPLRVGGLSPRVRGKLLQVSSCPAGENRRID